MTISLAAADFASLDFQDAAEMAGRCDFDGVELPTTRDPESNTAANALLTAPEKIRQIFTAANVAISALHIGAELSELPARITLASEVGSCFLKLKSDGLFDRGGTVLPSWIKRLMSSGDLAAHAGVTLLIENQPTAGSALRLWHLLDRINHPSIGCCWNTVFAARAGDSPAVAVPLLNSRIRAVELQDARGNVPCDIGDGELPLKATLNRLRGIGFTGNLLLRLRETQGVESTQIEQRLTAARGVLQRWQILPTAAAV